MRLIPAGGGILAEVELKGNKGDGLLVRDGAEPTVFACTSTGNGGYGATLKVAPLAATPPSHVSLAVQARRSVSAGLAVSIWCSRAARWRLAPGKSSLCHGSFVC